MKHFGTDGIRGKYNEHPITEKFAYDLARAFTTFLEDSPKIIVGRDTRPSGTTLQGAIVQGIIDSGGQPVTIDVLPTNAVSLAIQNEEADGGFMISASHNPASDNGFKLFNRAAFKLSEADEEKVERIIEENVFKQTTDKKETQELAMRELYIKHLTETCDRLDNVYVAVESGYGAGSRICGEIFNALGGQATGDADNNGALINTNGAMNPEKLRHEVTFNRRNAGIALDGDADRLVVVDNNGKILDGDTIISILAIHLKKAGKLNKNTVVVTHYSNSALDVELHEHGITVERVDVGDRNVTEAVFKNGYSL